MTWRIKFKDELLHASHQYIHRYMKDGKWVYVYPNENNVLGKANEYFSKLESEETTRRDGRIGRKTTSTNKTVATYQPPSSNNNYSPAFSKMMKENDAYANQSRYTDRKPTNGSNWLNKAYRASVEEQVQRNAERNKGVPIGDNRGYMADLARKKAKHEAEVQTNIQKNRGAIGDARGYQADQEKIRRQQIVEENMRRNSGAVIGDNRGQKIEEKRRRQKLLEEAQKARYVTGRR